VKREREDLVLLFLNGAWRPPSYRAVFWREHGKIQTVRAVRTTGVCVRTGEEGVSEKMYRASKRSSGTCVSHRAKSTCANIAYFGNYCRSFYTRLHFTSLFLLSLTGLSRHGLSHSEGIFSCALSQLRLYLCLWEQN
jgi:hypothetical protein